MSNDFDPEDRLVERSSQPNVAKSVRVAKSIAMADLVGFGTAFGFGSVAAEDLSIDLVDTGFGNFAGCLCDFDLQPRVFGRRGDD